MKILIIAFLIGITSLSLAQTYFWNNATSNVSTNLTTVTSLNNTLYCAGNNGVVLKSTDLGKSWANLNYPFFTHNFSGISTYNYNSSDYIFGIAAGGRFVRSTNGGLQWTYIILEPNGLTNLFVFNDPISGLKNIWVVGNDSKISSSINHGITWANKTPATANKIFTDVFFTTIDKGVVVGSDGTINITTNSGTNWAQVNSGTNNKLNGIFFFNQNQGWIVGDNGTILKTNDGGNSWIPQISNDTDNLQKVEFLDPSTGLIVGQNGTILTTSDGGNNWQQSSSGTTKNLYDIRIVDQETITIVGEQGTILTKGKQQFTLSKNISPTEAASEGCSVSANPNQSTYDANSSVLLTAAAGANWEFQEWSGGLSGSSSPQTILMNENKSVIAVFKKKVTPKVNLFTSVSPSEASADGCTVTPSGSNQYDLNSTVTLDASAGAGWIWDKWTGNLSGTNKPSTLLLNDEKNVVANFQPILTLSLSSPEEKNLCTPSLNEEVLIATAGIFVDGVDWLLTGISFTAVEKYKPRFTEAWIEYAGNKLKGTINVDADSNAVSYTFSPTHQINEGTTLNIKLMLKFQYPSKSSDKYIPEALTEVKKYKVSINVSQIVCTPIPVSARPGVKGPQETFVSNKQTMASVWNVSKEPDLPFATIKDAVESSQTSDNDLIKLCPGWFIENVTLNKSLSIFSSDGYEKTTWECFSKKDEFGSEQNNTLTILKSNSKISGITFISGSAGIFINNSTNRVVKTEIKSNYFDKNLYSVFIQAADSNIVHNNIILDFLNIWEGKDNIVEKNVFKNHLNIALNSKSNIISDNIFGDALEGIIIKGESEHNEIKRNYFGVNEDGITATNMLYKAIQIESNSNLIEENLICGTKKGIEILGSNNVIKNNILGLDKTKKVKIPNQTAIIVKEKASENIIEGNVLAGNSQYAIEFENDGNCSYNKIKNNLIGTNEEGLSELGNGVGISIAPNNPNNIIDGNTFGLNLTCLLTFSNSTEITNNKFGTDPTGKKPIPTPTGIFVGGEHTVISNNLFGNCGIGVVISASPKEGFSGSGKRNFVQYNKFGSDITEKNAINTGYSIYLVSGAKENYVENNFFGNVKVGIFAMHEGTTENYIRNNLIGINNSYTNKFKFNMGIVLYNVSTNYISGNVIGGEFPDSSIAIWVWKNSTKNHIKGNYVGTSSTGAIKIPNRAGIVLSNNSNDNTVVNNKVWYNQHGIEEDGCSNLILHNDIQYNTNNTGIHLINSNSKIIGNTILNDEHDAIKCEKGSNPLIVANNIYDNKGYGLTNADPKVKINAQGNYWGTSSLSINGNVNAANPLTSQSKLICVASLDTLFLPENGKDSVSVYYKNWNNLLDKILITITSEKPNWIISSKNIIADLSKPNSGESKIYFSLPAGSQKDEKAKVIINASSQSDQSLTMNDTLTAIVYKSQLNKIVIRPDSTTCSVGDTLLLSLAAFDQHSKSIDTPANIVWTVNGGTIVNNTKYIAGSKEGVFVISAKVYGTSITASAKIKIGEVTTSLNEHLEKTFPTDYSLYQNYPNPFNPETIIKYELPQKVLVTLKVYDILGREVATLVKKEQMAGRYEIKFSSNAYKLASGVYIYRIIAGTYSFTKKMLLIK